MTLTVFDPRAGEPVTITVPAYRPSPTRLGANILLALGTVTLAQVMAPATAQAQCNSNSKPPSPVVANFPPPQIFGNPPSLVPYNVTSLGLVGCKGPDVDGSGEPGIPGSPGQSGGQINSTNSALTIIGGFSQNGNTDSFGAPIVSLGGAGGAGGQGGQPSLNDRATGGAGGAGGAGGDLNVHFSGTFVPDQSTGLLATIGLVANSSGGQGGAGGPSNTNGFSQFFAGAGGAGGSGGSVTLVANGDIRAQAVGAHALSVGGAGGAGGNSSVNNLVSSGSSPAPAATVVVAARPRCSG